MSLKKFFNIFPKIYGWILTFTIFGLGMYLIQNWYPVETKIFTINQLTGVVMILIAGFFLITYPAFNRKYDK